MTPPGDLASRLLARAAQDNEFRARLIADPKAEIEREFGVTLAEDHEIQVHEETASTALLVIPPASERTAEEREAAKTGAASLEFLRKTMYDPAPPRRPAPAASEEGRAATVAAAAVADAARESIRRALVFLESTLHANGAWHCIRFNLARPEIPRHFERPAFVSAMCVLALERSNEARARAICARTKAYLTDTMEYPGLWRYYRHLPQDLDSTTLCSLAIGTHPWILLGRNLPPILANRDSEGRFMTWILADDQPDVVTMFRIEADPVVNANVIAFLGDRAETREAQHWLATLINEDRLEGSSKWYPDTVAVYYAITRAVIRLAPTLDHLRPTLTDRILGLRDEAGEFGGILETAQAVSALDDLDGLEHVDAGRLAQTIMSAQRDDGSWPELLAFGDQTLKWGVMGQIGHGSESITSAFCVEALERLAAHLTGVSDDRAAAPAIPGIVLAP